MIVGGHADVSAPSGPPGARSPLRAGRRNVMIEISGTAPEDLPAAGPISEVKKNLKKASRGFRKLDATTDG